MTQNSVTLVIKLLKTKARIFREWTWLDEHISSYTKLINDQKNIAYINERQYFFIEKITLVMITLVKLLFIY